MKRNTLAAIVLAGIFASTASQAMTAHEAELYEAAKKEGELTWYVSHFSGETAHEVASSFSEKYPGVKVNTVRTTAQVLYQRLAQELQANALQVDVVSSTDISHYVALKEKGLLMKHEPENASKIIEAFQNVDPDGYYHTTAAGLVAITYNSDAVPPDQAPRNWTDLLDPRWKDHVSIGHPAFSGYVGTWVVAMNKLYGWEFFEKLEKNNPRIGRSINDTVTMLNANESSVAAGAAATTLKTANKGNPLAVVYPEDGALLMISASAIMKDAKNPNGAKLFMEYLMSVDNARTMVKEFSESLRPEVPPGPGAKSVKDVKTMRPTLEDITVGIPEVKRKFRDTFGI